MPDISEHTLIAPPAAAAGALDADAEAAAEGVAGVLAAADVAALADVDAEVPELGESAWVCVAGVLLAAGGAPDFELLLQADAPKARTTIVAVATRALGRIATPNFGRGPSAPALEALPPPVTAR
ncbi:MAG TPA: hypothetical protein VGL75_10300 [Acidothermaceae bacterium]